MYGGLASSGSNENRSHRDRRHLTDTPHAVADQEIRVYPGHTPRRLVRPVLAYSIHVQGAIPRVGPKLLSPNKTIDHGHVTRHIERMHAHNVRLPVGDYFVYLRFSIGLRVQLKDAIDRHSIPIAFGAVLSRPIKLLVVLENPPRWPGRANIALYRVAAMRSPGTQRRIRMKCVEFIASPGTVGRDVGEQPPPSRQER